MRLCSKTLLAAAILFVASGSIAQELNHSTDAELMARLSYDNSGVVQRGDVRHECVAVSQSGDYRIVRTLDDGQTWRLHGKMAKEEFRQLIELLRADDFRNLPGNHGGLVREEAERFAAEIPLGDRSHGDENKTWRLAWLNADGENPFPASVSKLVDWLQRFQPKDGKSFEYADYPDVCPAVGLRLLQPSVAENLEP
jgi:hypothetical protein